MGLKHNKTTGQGNAEDITPAAKTIKVVEQKSASSKTRRPVSNNKKPHAPKKSTTLMRKAVQKPGPSFKRQVRVYTPLNSQGPLIQDVRAPSHSFVLGTKSVNNHTKRSVFISHFDHGTIEKHTTVEQTPNQTVTQQTWVIKPKVNNTPLTLDDMLQKALEKSTAHLEPEHKGRRRGLKRLTLKH